MQPFADNDIRASFINCSKGEARRIALPRNLSEVPWEDLDFLGWRDPGAPDRGYVVAERDGQLTGVTLRVPQGGPRSMAKTTMCSLCLTSHPGSGVSLLAARRVGAAGREGNTVGAYMCADLACSLYVRGKKVPELSMRYKETLSEEERITRMLVNLDDFLAKVRRG
ncbi:FBP domain-containing protein [Streptomyces roseoverticillatus]|uniref:FBP domain-containing protein n=1 Tax=Streptomyces roseoverticillatus TaxID=66429 RepID=UPI001F21EAE0|nr:FBP domain-containing protein [Streptomyces roseoverticillatus]MCF3104093.1 FBP domain-containing protein [Streptomyces roseoverticillatus]